MTVTRRQLIDGIRQHLACWPQVSKLGAAVDAVSNTIQLPDSLLREFIGQRALLQIGDEVMQVIEADEEVTHLRVLRGYMGSTKATHAKDDDVQIFPSWGWTDYELVNNILPKCYSFLKPYLWSHAVSTTFTWPASSFEATLPVASGISTPSGNYLYRLQAQNLEGYWQSVFNYRQFGTTIQFSHLSSRAWSLRAYYCKFQGVLATDAATLDNDDAAEPLELYAAHLCLNALKTNRVRFAEYSAALNDRASTVDELIRLAYDLKNQAIVAREERGRPLPATYASSSRD